MLLSRSLVKILESEQMSPTFYAQLNKTRRRRSDTTQDSWHGLPKPLTCPSGKYRKSLAVYYLTDVDENTEERYRALFVPTEEQLTDPEIVKLCKERSK